MDKYTVYTWDCEANCWEVYQPRLSLFALRAVLKSLRRSWSDDAFKVCRDDLGPEYDYDRDLAREARQFQIECDQTEQETELDEHPLFAGMEASDD